jgi:hypothetical protein
MLVEGGLEGLCQDSRRMSGTTMDNELAWDAEVGGCWRGRWEGWQETGRPKEQQPGRGMVL